MKMSLLDLSWFLLESKAIPVHGGFLYVFSPPAGAKADFANKIFMAMRKRPVGAPFEGVSTWRRREVQKEDGPGALRKATSLLSEAVRAVADVSKAFTNHGTGAVSGSARRPMPFSAPEVRAERGGSSLRTYGMS